jgi:hypothetical protein
MLLFCIYCGDRSREAFEFMTVQTSFTVTVIDNFHRHDVDTRIVVCGFENLEQAMSYGMRRVRSSIEQFRQSDQTRDQLYRTWIALGEEVEVDGARIGLGNFDRFYKYPATAQECDYLLLQPQQPDG